MNNLSSIAVSILHKTGGHLSFSFGLIGAVVAILKVFGEKIIALYGQDILLYFFNYLVPDSLLEYLDNYWI